MERPFDWAALCAGVVVGAVSVCAYAALSFVVCHAYTDHWPLHPWWVVAMAAAPGVIHGVKTARACRE